MRVTCLQTARDSVGPIGHGADIFILARGEYNFSDLIVHAAEEAGIAAITVWTWAIAHWDIEYLRSQPSIFRGLLIASAQNRTLANARAGSSYYAWREAFGPDSVRFTVSHAKMALVRSATRRILIRGSANANKNQRAEQYDITEGGADYELVERMVGEFEERDEAATLADISRACKLGAAPAESDGAFVGCSRWSL